MAMLEPWDVPVFWMSHVSLVCGLDAARPECGKLEFIIKMSPYEDVYGLLHGVDTLTRISVKHMPKWFFFSFFLFGFSWS